MSFQVEGDRIPVAREGELYSLKWHTFQTHLTAGLKQFLLDGEFLTDVTLVAEGKMIRSHRMLLSLCSPHFKQLFQGNSAANTNTIVILNNVRYQDLQHVIQFIYNGEVKVSNNHELQGFLQTGELLQIEGLTKAGTNNETEGQEPQGPGRVSPVTQSTPTPGMNRRSHQQVPQGTARTGSHIQNVTSNASSLIGDTKIKPQQKLSIPSTSQSSHHAPPAKRTRLATASATVTSATTKYDVSNDNSITGDLNQSAEGMSEIDPLSVSGMQQRDPLMEESGVDPDLEEEQMITIDSIKSETVVDDGSLGMYGERSDDDGTFELTEHGEHSGLGVEDVYGGGALGVDDMNLAGPSSALSGASGSNAGVLSKPPGTLKKVRDKRRILPTWKALSNVADKPKTSLKKTSIPLTERLAKIAAAKKTEELTQAIEPNEARQNNMRSRQWVYFEKLANQKVKCKVCSKTMNLFHSLMAYHLIKKHPNEYVKVKK